MSPDERMLDPERHIRRARAAAPSFDNSLFVPNAAASIRESAPIAPSSETMALVTEVLLHGNRVQRQARITALLNHIATIEQERDRAWTFLLSSEGDNRYAQQRAEIAALRERVRQLEAVIQEQIESCDCKDGVVRIGYHDSCPKCSRFLDLFAASPEPERKENTP